MNDLYVNGFPMKNNIPIYIISFNRLDALRRSIESYVRFFDYDDIVIIDNASDYPELLDYYKHLARKGVTIHKNRKIQSAEELDSIGPIINKDLSQRHCEFYVVTDPDISIESVPDDFLDVLKYLLNKFPWAKIVGPMLRIDDIPADFPDREEAWRKHMAQFWTKYPDSIRHGDTTVYFQRAGIDTTFGMLRATQPFKRLLKGVRTYHPYEAKHLDWYITPKTITPDQIHYQKSTSRNISNWHGDLPKHADGRIARMTGKLEWGFFVEQGEVVFRNVRTGESRKPKDLAYRKMLMTLRRMLHR